MTWHQKNRARVNAWHRAWRKSNPSKERESCRRYAQTCTPPRFDYGTIAMSRQLAEHVGFDIDNPEHHGAIGTCDFDYEQVFADLDEPLAAIRRASPSAREEAAELVRRLATWCFKGNRPLRCALVKMVAIFSGLRPDMLADRSGRDLARELGITKQALSHQAVRFEDAFQIKFARSRSQEARGRMAASRRGGPNRNPGKHQPPR